MKFSANLSVNYHTEIEADSLDEAFEKALLSVPNCVEYNGDGIFIEGIDNDLIYEE